jgi:glycosyltransferase involved in cell wall biosynthesis
MFSVAIPTFNRGSCLAATLNSVLSQTYPPVEVVVVDDGSTDDTQQVLAQFADRVISRRVANSGPGAARKAAIELCASSWIALCDSDDLWQPDHLKRRARLIATFPEADFTFSNFTESGEGGRIGYDKFQSMPVGWWDHFPKPTSDGFRLLGKSTFDKFVMANPAFPSTIAIRRSLYERVGGIRDKFSRVPSEDADLTRRCVAAGCVACDTAITVELRKHADSFSADALKTLLGRIEILEESMGDGSVPRAHLADVAEAIRTTRQQALRAAFFQRDFETFAAVSSMVPFSGRPPDLKLRSVLARLPGPLRKSLLWCFGDRD